MDRLPTAGSVRETSLSSMPSPDAASAGEARPRVRVRYWASIKAAAGTPGDDVCGVNVAEVLTAVRRLHVDNPRFGRILEVCSVLLGERPLGTADPSQVRVEDGAVVDLLPPFAGGAG